jgi:Rrf2 family protein
MLSKSCEYAIRSVLCVANHQLENHDKFIGIKELSDLLDIPLHFLGKIMQNLTRHNILDSSKGRNGGFFLSQKQLSNSLMNIVGVVDGVKMFNRCGLGLSECSETHPCPLHNDFAVFRDNFARALKTHTILSMAQAYQKGQTFLVSLKN